jgi:hypothetical protein
VLAAAGAIAWWLWRGRWRDLVPLGLPLVLVGLAALAYDALRYGTPFSFPSYQLPQRQLAGEGRFGRSLRNLYQYTISPNQGIFWYSPPTLAVLGRVGHGAAGLLAAALVPLGAFYLVGWGLSSWAWGLRYTYVFVPALVLPLAWLRPGRGVALLGLGLAVQLLAVLHDPLELYQRELARVPGLTIQQVMTQRAHAPLRLALTDTPATLARGRDTLAGAPPPPGPLRHRGLPDVWWLLALLEAVPRKLVAAAAGTLAIAALLFGGLFLRAWRAEGPPEV